MHDWGRYAGSLSYDERLFVEAADESLVPFSMLMSLDVALGPG